MATECVKLVRMRLPGRRPAPPAEAALPRRADAEQQAAWDADGAPVHPRRKAILALGLAALLVVAVLVVARARGDGDILALGSTPKSSSTIAPVPNLDPITGDPLFEGSQLLPGDTVPGGGPAGAQPGAAGVVDPGAAAGGAGGGGQAAGGATPGDQSGGVAGGGVPTPTTRPGSGGGGATTTSTTQGGGNPPASTTIAPGPPPSPACSVTDQSVDPARVGLKGQSGKLDSNLKVQFRATSACGSGFRVQVNGQDVPAAPGPGGLLIATISDDAGNWARGAYTISIRNSAGAVIVGIPLTVI